jgi:hypothetical protein
VRRREESGRPAVNRLFQPLADWRSVATDVRGKTLPTGHFLAEEAPEATLAELPAFFGGRGSPFPGLAPPRHRGRGLG